jgi:Tudor domain
VLEENEIRYVEELKVGDKVNIIAIISEKILYVRRLKNDGIGELTQIYKFSKAAEKLNMYPEVGDLILAQVDDEICRARVLNVSDDESLPIFLQLIDYGNTARVNFDKLLVMNPQCQAVKCATLKVALSGVDIPAVNQNMISYLCGLRTNNNELTVKQITAGEILLQDSQAIATSVNEEIVRLSQVPDAKFNDHAITVEVSKTNFQFQKPNINLSIYFQNMEQNFFIPLENNQKVFVVNSKPILDKSDFICCVAEHKLKDFMELYKAINHYGNNYKAETGLSSSEHGVCLVRCNEQWHRAYLRHASGTGKPYFDLLDIYSLQKVSVKDVIPIPEMFAICPVMSELCKIKGTPSDHIEEGTMINPSKITYDKKEQILILHFNEL